jgi:hypothetical protein
MSPGTGAGIVDKFETINRMATLFIGKMNGALRGLPGIRTKPYYARQHEK